MAQENIIGAVKLPIEVLQQVLPAPGDTATLGDKAHTKVEYLGKAYLIHWVPAIQVLAIGDLEAIDAELAEVDKQEQLVALRKAATEDLKARFNTMTATPVTLEPATTEGAPLKVVR